MSTKKANKKVLGLAALILIIMAVYSLYSMKELDRNGIYGVGKIVRIQAVAHGRRVYIEHWYNNKLHRIDGITYEHGIDTGQYVIIKFLSSNPDECDFYPRYVIPDSLKTLNGRTWEKIPPYITMGSTDK
ncbi:MAG: hypothetical protein JST70_12185 [Bacteroidetes bacterium]|nr:hypothetical protein [Bacteroidota bacterium]